MSYCKKKTNNLIIFSLIFSQNQVFLKKYIITQIKKKEDKTKPVLDFTFIRSILQFLFIKRRYIWREFENKLSIMAVI